ncbi:MAG: FtsH protease activity modulator HflK [Gammaproteobacteria bacterium]|nr:FtsH protease activity modulator HflK [Gammaproteobacteria bacterium]
MAWNEPGNKDKDPWGGNKGGKDQGPPDLDEVINNLSKKFSGLLGGKSGGKSGGTGGGSISGPGIALLGVIGVAIWVVSGFYTIKEAERGFVLQFGQAHESVEPGLHWKRTFIDTVIPVDIRTIRSFSSAGFMLTKDENVVRVEMDVQYRVVDPEQFLFSVVNPANSISQAMDSALRYVVGHTTMDDLLTTGREVVRQKTEVELRKVIEPYKLGLEIVDVNFLPARPPEEVKGSFDDAIAAQEDEERFIREAEAYALSIEPLARGQVRRLEQEAKAYKEQAILKATGETARFNQLLPQYQAAKEVTRQRIYLETIESVYANTSKVMVDVEGGNNMLYLPLDQIIKQSQQGTPARSTSITNSLPRNTSNVVNDNLRSFSRDATRQGRN